MVRFTCTVFIREFESSKSGSSAPLRKNQRYTDNIPALDIPSSIESSFSNKLGLPRVKVAGAAQSRGSLTASRVKVWK